MRSSSFHLGKCHYIKYPRLKECSDLHVFNFFFFLKKKSMKKTKCGLFHLWQQNVKVDTYKVIVDSSPNCIYFRAFLIGENSPDNYNCVLIYFAFIYDDGSFTFSSQIRRNNENGGNIWSITTYWPWFFLSYFSGINYYLRMSLIGRDFDASQLVLTRYVMFIL